jgi:mRNA interferase MazF
LTDVVVEESHSEFVLTGLKVSSVIRLDKIATILKDLVVGEIGELGSELKREVNLRLRKVYRP